jgi:hypothetical protein
VRIRPFRKQEARAVAEEKKRIRDFFAGGRRRSGVSNRPADSSAWDQERGLDAKCEDRTPINRIEQGLTPEAESSKFGVAPPFRLTLD